MQSLYSFTIPPQSGEINLACDKKKGARTSCFCEAMWMLNAAAGKAARNGCIKRLFDAGKCRDADLTAGLDNRCRLRYINIRSTIGSAPDIRNKQGDTAMAENENKSTASLVLGIISLIVWLLPLIGFPVSIVGLILGVRKKYTVGIVLNVIGLVITVANSAIGAYMGAMAARG